MALGDVDELNSQIGVAREFLGKDLGLLSEFLAEIQCRLLDAGSNIATPCGEGGSEEKIQRSQFDAQGEAVKRLEAWIDFMDATLPPLTAFILPVMCFS